MSLLRPTTIIAAILIIAFSAPRSLLSQTAPKPSRPNQPAPQLRRLGRSNGRQALDVLSRMFAEITFAKVGFRATSHYLFAIDHY